MTTAEALRAVAGPATVRVSPRTHRQQGGGRDRGTCAAGTVVTATVAPD
jgi:hypothetical protein